jgi:hypothetical protein
MGPFDAILAAIESVPDEPTASATARAQMAVLDAERTRLGFDCEDLRALRGRLGLVDAAHHGHACGAGIRDLAMTLKGMR